MADVLACKFMYESTETRYPLYSMPHLSLAMTGLPVRSLRNGFGLTGTCRAGPGIRGSPLAGGASAMGDATRGARRAMGDARARARLGGDASIQSKLLDWDRPSARGPRGASSIDGKGADHGHGAAVVAAQGPH